MIPATTAALITAGAAGLAALLSGITLILNLRRSEVTWFRDSLTETVVRFLDASFEAPGERSLGKALTGAYDADDITRHREAHEAMLTALTRLRVLASARVVEAAEEVHAADSARTRLIKKTELDVDQWREIGQRRNAARERLLENVRRDLRLGPAKRIDSYLMRIPFEGQGD